MTDFEGLSYNSSRQDLAIPEYGRNIHKMIDFAKSVEDKEERNKVAHAIINVMGQLFPYLRDIEDYNHKLWDHLHIMADYQLDVDSPYPIPSKEELNEKPERVAYPQSKVKYGHYGKILEDLIQKASAYEEGEEKNTLSLIIANLMKKHYLTWNRSSVEDALIKNQLNQMSGGKISLAEDVELISTQEVLKSIKPQHNRSNKKGSNNKKKKKKY
ncbi:MAG: DUF4290 domain-containing protein [Flavobacteriales bacterium]|nr:DUF4290 domain-containing protein [Flavobacteriales bacterium]